ncbi:MAG: twitching motility protein PilT [Acidobacteria bacterium RIFCSPLOWO2_02_FULL_67_36]|nr:MAG: twitching motility protein PilT [Acidobacteria bacterium RIFCSPLOWO2_02_FULL_67_36]OFW25772.1 MAG: twitching motility protein PilT [Acidobacteria bacterium RIFCSPLOWO2_12_FULL_66_21]
MKLLVDTHAFLWFMAGDERLSRGARRAVERASGDWCLSAASIWEMSIKASLGRLALPAPAEAYIAEKVRQGLRVLAIEWPHAAAVERLPFHHHDPFDRLIVAQAQAERLAVVTRDAVFSEYGIKVVW